MTLPKPYYQDSAVTLYHGDCRELVPLLGRFDLLLTDPPYGLGDRLHGGKGEWSGGFSVAPSWDTELAGIEIINRAVGLCDNSIIWGGNYYSLPPVRGWLAWDKMQEHTSGHFELAWSNLDIPTRSFRMSRIEAYGAMDKAHPTQKPEQLLTWCLGFAPEARTVLDPFAGSGTTGRACKDLGRKCVMIEREENYCEIAAKRCRQEVLNFV